MSEPAAFRATLAEKISAMMMPIAESGCWAWLGHVDTNGYGTVRVNGKMEKAHRASWQAHHGPVPNEMKILHKCDVRCCVNPDHLFCGTQLENVRDMINKNRRADYRGESNNNSKLTDADVMAIRVASGTLASIAEKFGVSLQMISLIRRGESWRHM